jgi:hypothetical protein
MMGKSLELALVPSTFLSQEPHYIHDEMSDTSPSSGPTDIHDYVLEHDVAIVMDNEKLLFEEQAKMMDMAVDSKITIFSPTKKAVQAWRHPGTNPSHDLESVYMH